MFAGTFVVQGEAEAVVSAVAGNTRLAGIQTLTESADRPPSPLTVELHRLIRVIAVIAVAVGVCLTAASLLLGLSVTEAILFGVGVMVALVPEGLLPTVTLSLARGAQRMAHGNALVRRLDAVATLGATTYVCTDKTGTLTMNQMEVLEVWTPYGVVAIQGRGYEPVGSAEGDPAAIEATAKAAASTGDGVNDAPALREADVGVAMGASGSDVARAAADLVLLDDHFASIVTAIRLGRATFSNVRRSLTYHLADNVAELAPFVGWALSGGSLPLAIGVLQVLALDIGADVLPALALGVERPGPRILEGPARHRRLVDRRLLGRAFGVLGLTEAVVAMTAFVVILTGHGWRFGAEPSGAALAVASGTAFAVIVLMQMANSLACRSERSTLVEIGFTTNRPLLLALAAEMVLLTVFLGVPPVAELLGGGWPSLQGWLFAAAGVIVLLVVDASTKLLRRSRTRG